MESAGLRRELFTSLVGAAPLTDVLADMPLPAHIPTPVEQGALGNSDLSADARKLLNTTDPELCSKITQALLSVDPSFLDLKEAVDEAPYVPNSKAPPLIRAIIDKKCFPQPVIRMRKLDPAKYSISPMKGAPSPDAAAPLQPIQDPSHTSKQRKTNKHKLKRRPPEVQVPPGVPQSTSAVSQRPKRRTSSSSSTETQTKKGKPNSLVVSIDRDSVSPQRRLVPGSGMRVKKRRQADSAMKGGDKLMVKVSRSKLKSRRPANLDNSDGMKGFESLPDGGYMRAADQVEPSHEPQKSVKKKRHRKIDPAKAAALKHFSDLLEGLFDSEDQFTSDDDLISRPVLARLLSEIAKLKQQAILHEISAEKLVRVIGIMDKHVLDAAELQLNAIPGDAETEPRVWRELSRDRILRSIDAALVILHITTAPNVPTNVHLEESIEQLIAATKFHLDNNVYPAFDPVYRAENKEYGVLPRQKRRYASGSINKDTLAIYHKLTEMVEVLALLLETQPLTDTTVLQLSTLGTFPFFVENVSALQLSALRLVRAIFSRYEKHRDLILEDIFASLARLPTTKRNLRNFKLSNGQSIQMVSALMLQLVQCIVVVPQRENPSPPPSRPDTPTGSENGEEKSNDQKPDIDVQMINSYELALRTGKTFLSTFLKKCCGGKDEDDFRPLFDNFVHDLLITLNLPEWPASEVLLTLLGMLLVHGLLPSEHPSAFAEALLVLSNDVCFQEEYRSTFDTVHTFSNRSHEQSLRLTSLDHLGVIAAHLRKDATTSLGQDHEELIDILAQILQSKLEKRSTPSPTSMKRLDAFSENNQHLQKALIAFLNRRSEGDPACAYARDFYIGQWLQDTQVELEKVLKGSPHSPTSPSDTLSLDHDAVPAISQSASILQQAEVKKDMLHSLMEAKTLNSLRHLEAVLDEQGAATVTRFLASSRALSRSFDMYLQQLLRVLNEPAVHVRTRAMKALSTIIAADPSILSRSDMQRAVQNRFMDHSTLVRESAVDLVGRFVLSRPELTSQYYEMLTERILDTGVSVRKRVIKILKDICVLQPDFPKVNEVCVKMIRRITDEEGIKQLVTGVFRDLWFTAPPEGAEQKEILIKRVTNIVAVVGSCKEYEWFEQLLEQLMKSGDSAVVKSILEVSQLMVDCLVENVLTLDENAATGQQGSSSPRLVACITTLYLFCKIKPTLLLKHATTLHPYLGSKCLTQSDIIVLHYVAQVLRQVVPLMEHPSETFLAGLEEDLIKLIMKHGQMIVQSCVSCLGEVVNTVTHNYVLVKDCFQKFFMCLERVRTLHSQDCKHPQLPTLRPSLLRSLFTVGLMCKHFDVDSISTQASPASRRVYSHLTYFSRHEDEEVQLKAVMGLGFFCVRYPELMLEDEAKQLYHEWLTRDCASKKKCQVLRNLQNHLKEVETKLKVADKEWSKRADKEDLLEFGDHHSSVSSNIAQAFLFPVLNSFFHVEMQVRLGALQAIILILRQGLVHPAQCVPYLIVMSTDPEQSVKVKSDQQLSDHSSRYGHFMQTHLIAGMKKSFEFQQILVGDVIRGCSDITSSPQSLLSHVYSLVRSNKQHRRAFLRALLRHFEDYEKNPLSLLLYLADNLAYLPYNTLEEPLFVVHHLDMTISVTGSSLLQSFREALGSSSTTVPDDDDEDLQNLSQSESCNLHQLAECCHSCQGCFLLLLLKQHLKKSYSLSDSKCQRYSPNGSNKAYDKTVSRKTGVTFDPRLVIEEVKLENLGRRVLKSKEEYLKQYFEFKQLMNMLDPFEGEDEVSDQENVPTAPSAAPAPPAQVKQQPEKEEADSKPCPVSDAPVVSSGRRRSRSRASSTSSAGSRRERGLSSHEGGPKPKRRRILISSSDSDDDPEFKA